MSWLLWIVGALLATQTNAFLGLTPPRFPEVKPPTFLEVKPPRFPEVEPPRFPEVEPPGFPEVEPTRFPEVEPTRFIEVEPTTTPKRTTPKTTQPPTKPPTPPPTQPPTKPPTTAAPTTQPPPPVVPCKNNTKADIIFVLDASSSIGVYNWGNQTKFASELTEAFNVGPEEVHFATITFNNVYKKYFDLKDHYDHPSLSKSLLDIAYPKASGTRTDLGLQFVLDDKMFSTEKGGRPDASDIVIIMTDGKSDDHDQTIAAANRLKAAGITIISVGIGSAVDQNELKSIASKPEYVFTSISYSLLDYVKRDLVKLTCDKAS